MPSECALCGRTGAIRQSHIMPKFAPGWIKRTSATGYMVRPDDGARRVQDAIKVRLLCDDCEELFSRPEKYFAEKIFYPFHDKGVRSFDYDENLGLFAASLSWRALRISYDKAARGLPGFVPAINKADARWRGFLLGERRSIEPYESHLIFLDNGTCGGEFLGTKWHTARSVDATLAVWEGVFAYSLLPGMAIVTSVQPARLPFHGPPIKPSGKVEAGHPAPDSKFYEFIARRAAEVSACSPGPPAKEGERRLMKASEKDPSRVIKSETIRVMMDVTDANRVRRMRERKMPETIIKLVEDVILKSSNACDSGVEDNAARWQTGRVADALAGLPKEEAERTAREVEGVVDGALAGRGRAGRLIRTSRVWVVFMACRGATKEAQHEKIRGIIRDLLPQQAGAGAPIVVISMNIEGSEWSFELGSWAA